MRHTRLHKSKWLPAAALVAAILCAGCLGGKKSAKAVPVDTKSAEPDKLLYEKATNDIKHGNHTVGRLELQTLLNTYPDSEYQAKAKLAIADSYFKEGGASNLTQSIAEYQDFITFFPFLDEAAYAQSQVGMAHYRAMEKPDRDRDEALEAEGAFQTFLQKYPSSPLRPQMEQRLREVQEVLAEGDFRIANFYYIRGVYLASAARLADLVQRYPLYSQADRANWMLGSIYERTEHNEYAATMYSQIVKNYPLSSLADDAKAKLTKFGVPVPQADPKAMARMQTEQNLPRRRGSLATRPLGMLKNSPDVSMAAHSGAPNLAPEDDGTGGAVLQSGAAPAVGAPAAAIPAAPSGGTGAFVETVTPGSPDSIAPTAGASGAAADPQPGAATDAQPAAGSTDAAGNASSTPAATTPTTQPESTSKKKKHKFIVF